MVGLERVGNVRGRAGPCAPCRTSGDGFSVPETGVAAQASTATPAALAIGGMLALQEVATGSLRDRAARRHAQEVLAELARLQRSLLAGRPDGSVLRRLAELVRAMPAADDPRLTAALAEVDLRAQVELARHESVIHC